MKNKKRNLKNRINEITTLLVPIVFTFGMFSYWVVCGY